jgi:hypothetical protein
MRHLALRYEARRAVASLVGRVSDVGARRWIGRMTGCWRRCGFGEWAAEEKESGALIGRIGLVRHREARD